MPNAENAILDPFSAMAPTEAIMVAVCGLVVVFLMLAILALVIRINSKLVSLLEGRKEEPAPAPSGGDELINAIIMGRDGKAVKRTYTKEQMEALRKVIDVMPYLDDEEL